MDTAVEWRVKETAGHGEMAYRHVPAAVLTAHTATKGK